MNPLLATILRIPKTVIIFVLLLTLFLGYTLRNLTMEPDVTKAIPKKIAAKRLYDRMGEIFPTQEFVFIGLSGSNVFTPEHMETVWRLTQQLEDYEAVYSVISPVNISIIQGTVEGIEVYDILEAPPRTPKEIKRFKTDLFHSDLALGNLVSRNGDALGIMVFLKKTADVPAFIRQLIGDMEAFDRGTDLQLLLTGKQVVNYYVSQGMQRDMGVFFLSGFGIIFLLLLIVFHNLRGVLLPLSVVIFSVIWTLGCMALLGRPMSHATEILPILIMAIAVADSIHILSHFYHHAGFSHETSSVKVTEVTMQEMNAPVIMTSLTTMAGFIALGTVGSESVAELGLFTALGVFFALILTLTWIPAFLVLLKIPRRFREATEPRFTADRMAAWGTFLVRKAKWLKAFIMLVVVVAALGFTRLHHTFSSIGNFPADHPLRLANEWVNTHFSGTTGFDVMIEGREDLAIQNPALLEKLDRLKTLALQQEHVGSVQSIADFIKRINKVLHAGDSTEYRIPPVTAKVTGTDWVEQDGEWVPVEREFEVSGRELVAQYLQLLEMSGKPQDMDPFVDYAYRHARMNILINTDDMATLRKIDRELTRFIDEELNSEGVTAAVTGMAKLITVVDDMIVTGQIWSILTSLGLVWFLTSLMFRSVVIGFFNTIPLFFSLLLNFAFMGYTGINLNLETLITSSIAIGVGVDYAIHFIHRYRIKLHEGLDYKAAVPATMRESGLAIFFNSITVAAGFSIIAMSQFVAIRQMGILISLTMLTAAFGALTIVPGIFLILKPRSLQK